MRQCWIAVSIFYYLCRAVFGNLQGSSHFTALSLRSIISLILPSFVSHFSWFCSPPPPLPSAAGCPLVSLYKTLHWDFQCNSAWWLPLTGLSNSVRSHGWKIHILNWALTSHTPKLDNIAIKIYDLKNLSKNFFKMLLLS